MDSNQLDMTEKYDVNLRKQEPLALFLKLNNNFQSCSSNVCQDVLSFNPKNANSNLYTKHMLNLDNEISLKY